MLTRDLGPYPFKSPQSSVAATYKVYVGGVLDYGVWKVVWSLEKILDHVWSFLYVNEAGGPEGSSDASSVSVKEFRLMRNSQPIYVTRWLATCCCAESLLETLLVMLHKLRTNLLDGGSKVCTCFEPLGGGFFFEQFARMVHEEEKKNL